MTRSKANRACVYAEVKKRQKSRVTMRKANKACMCNEKKAEKGDDVSTVHTFGS